MLRVILSAACSIAVAIGSGFLFTNYARSSRMYAYSEVQDYLLVVIGIAFCLSCYVFYAIVFKNVPTLKNTLMKAVADSKDILHARNTDSDTK